MPRNLCYGNSSDRWMRVQTQAGTAYMNRRQDNVLEIRHGVHKQTDEVGEWEG